jgi:NAD(P)H-hydrate epimerase
MKPTTTLPVALYRAEQVREMDRLAIEKFGIAGAELMERAGRFAFDVLRARWPRASRLRVVCGPGNNGGDGYVLARLAKEQGYDPLVLALGEVRSGSEAAGALAYCKAAGVAIRPYSGDMFKGADVIVDALLGIGLERELTGEWRAAVQAINDARRPVLAIDIPTGLHADTGRVLGAAVRADVTVCFIGLKAGLYAGAGPEHRGDIYFSDLGVPEAVYQTTRPIAQRLVETRMRALMRPRPRTAHKGDFGRVLIIGGDQGMPGAVRLAGEAAYRAGAGLVTLATHPLHSATINTMRPELIVHGVKSAAALKPLLARTTVIALGPGLGRGAWGKTMFAAALAAKLPLVIDADALYFLAQTKKKRDDWILTPHPGEAARLLGVDSERIQGDRFAAAASVAKRYGGICVLKGAGTIVASSNETPDVCDRGNPGMASGGTGDVLTGVIAALRAQGLGALDAARLGVWAHAIAGDAQAEQGGEIGLLASDLPPGIRAELNRLSHEDA